MGAVRKSIIIATGLAAAGIGYVVGEAYVTNQVPGYALSPMEQLPPEIPQANGRGLVCPAPADANPCTPANALATFALRDQQQVAFADMSQNVKTAIVVAEDKNFYSNSNLDVHGRVRALVKDIKNRRIVAGGSDIPSQAAKNTYEPITQEQLKNESWQVRIAFYLHPKLGREVAEMSEALKMEQLYTKDQILEMYLNRVYFGRGAYGVQAAAQAYFGIDAKDLNMQQSIILAALLPGPSSMDITAENQADMNTPQIKTQETLLQQNIIRVTDELVSTGHMTAQEADSMWFRTSADGSREFVELHIEYYQPVKNMDMTNAAKIGAEHAVVMAIADSAKRLGISVDAMSGGDGAVITTTIRTGMQAALNDTLKNDPSLKNPNVDLAGVSEDADGNVVAMVGSGRNFTTHQVNLADSVSNSGSSFKEYAWAYAFDKGWLPDEPGQITVPASVTVNNGHSKWTVIGETGCNFLYAGKQPPCEMTPGQALAFSSNTEAATILKKAGSITPLANVARDIGTNISKKVFPANILGYDTTPLDSVTGFDGLTLGMGSSRQYNLVTSVIYKGKTLEFKNPSPKEVFSKAAAAKTIKAMRKVVTDGTAKGAIKVPAGTDVAGKTGTAGPSEKNSGNSAVWFVGAACYNPTEKFVSAIWIGNPANNKPIKGILSYNAAQAFGRYILKVPHTPGTCDMTAGTN